MAFNDLDRIFVNGYNPVTSKDNVLVYQAMEGLGATSTDLTKNPNPLTGAAPNGFGFCESTWTGFSNCTGGPGSPYGVPFEARVNTAYSIFLDANATVQATNQPFSTSSAEATLDPVISFGPGFDSTGYSIALSPGIGNEASSVPTLHLDVLVNCDSRIGIRSQAAAYEKGKFLGEVSSAHEFGGSRV